ncbi:hypothetical protein E2C01_079230 [Portunus trituberculatus]|uniref:Uncharacterized protein n=1 Tax=Portunus trituberculatus TaxID=210409 RepID=A0A5B7IGF1_PORTR|nr:hypothetical protein [Portunus trituberculatus]
MMEAVDNIITSLSIRTSLSYAVMERDRRGESGRSPSQPLHRHTYLGPPNPAHQSLINTHHHHHHLCDMTPASHNTRKYHRNE